MGWPRSRSAQRHLGRIPTTPWPLDRELVSTRILWPNHRELGDLNDLAVADRLWIGGPAVLLMGLLELIQSGSGRASNGEASPGGAEVSRYHRQYCLS